jgi:hypothetical protein
MSSLRERIEALQQDLVATPMRISAYHDLPFAIFRYDPEDEHLARKEAVLLARRLENAGRQVHFFSLARALWEAVRRTEGLDAIVEAEREWGFERTQRTVSALLSDPDFLPLAAQLEAWTKGFDPPVDVVFLVRAAALAPGIYRCARLLDEMHHRTMVPMILFYPGTIEGTTALRFMALPDREPGAYNYRVRIY